MFDYIKLKIAVKMEVNARKIKRRYAKRILNSFLKNHNLVDEKPIKKKDIRFNPYECTNLLLIEELINSKEISIDDYVMDIGCGSGIFLIYLASKGFKNLFGIEMEDYLYNRCISNVHSFKDNNLNNYYNINIYHENALDITDYTDITCFYLFNTFYNEDTYTQWLNLIKNSIENNKRKIKIIILYPTISSMSALRKCDWLYEKRRVFCEEQACYQCMHFIIYESKDD